MSYFKKSLLFHFILLALVMLFYHANPPFQKRRVIHTSTVKLSSAIAAATGESSPVSPATAPPPEPTKKKEEPKKEKVVKKEEPKKPAVKAEPKKEVAKKDPKKENLLKEARDSLAKMGKTEATSKTASPQKSTLSSLKAEGMNFSVKGETDLYTSELISRLKLNLRLPENGEVVVDVTLLRTGKVAAIYIKDAKSMINKLYVESYLPNLSFPEFGESYPNKDEKLFTLSLQNAIF